MFALYFVLRSKMINAIILNYPTILIILLSSNNVLTFIYLFNILHVMGAYSDIWTTSLKKILYRWRASSWSACSVPCGGGIRRRNVTCTIDSGRGRSSSADPYRCPDPVPLSEEMCNMLFCPAAWETGSWSSVWTFQSIMKWNNYVSTWRMIGSTMISGKVVPQKSI